MANTSKLDENSGISDYSFVAPKGISEQLVRDLSRQKNEPTWMLEYRLAALSTFVKMELPRWGADLSNIKWDDIHYYLKPVDRPYTAWSDVPDSVRNVFDAIGVPQAERQYLSGVGGQYDSEVIYHSLHETLSKKGVVFLSMDEGLKKYPEIVKKYFASVVPIGDNKLAALNTAFWSGGSFVYIPKGVKLELPLQAYFRINAENAGQFERTLIVAEEESSVHYVEGCFPAGAKISTNNGEKNIEDIIDSDLLLSHKGIYRKIIHIQKRLFSGELYTINYYGDSTRKIVVTEEHPFLVVRRRSKHDRNKTWEKEWIEPKEIRKGDYLTIPIDKTLQIQDYRDFDIKEWTGRKAGFKNRLVRVKTNADLFRLIGYYLAEGSISTGSYLNFSFAEEERDYIEDVKEIVKNVFGLEKSHESHHKKNHGTSVVFNSVELCRIFEQFGTHNEKKYVPEWVLHEEYTKQKELIKGWFFGDGNYYSKQHKSGYKEAFRVNTTSRLLASQMVSVLRRLHIPAFVNSRDRSREGRRTMYTVGVTGEWMIRFGEIVGVSIEEKQNEKNRASMFGCDDNYVYVPINLISHNNVTDLTVYNFGVEEDESYVAEGVAVHNCSAPAYSSASLHAAVVEVVVKNSAKVRYTTVQNWYKNVYNLVTKRARVEESARMEWVDCNLGSGVTMKYPACLLVGERAHGEMLSIAVAGDGQHLDAGAKMIHLAPNTTSRIVSKSISQHGGRSSYRGMVKITPSAVGSRSKVVCDALIMDPESRSDTYPNNQILTGEATLEHEAYVSKIGEEQLLYLMSRGMSEHEAETLIVRGFLEPVIKELPMEYAVELNRLIKLEMVGSVG